jgi:stage II sporulation protein D
MMRILALLLLAIAPMTSAHADISAVLRSAWGKAAPPTPPTVKVLVIHDQDGAILEVKGKYRLIDPNTQEDLSGLRFVGKSQYVQALHSGLKWGEEFPDVHQIAVTPGASDTEIYVNGTRYPGTIYIYDNGNNNKLSLVNELPIEDYLTYALNNRYPSNLSDETLAALAIAERTNAYYQAQHPKSKFYALDGLQSDYKGVVAYDTNSGIQKALRNTRYMVMSRTGLYEGIVTPFALNWDKMPNKGESSQISLNDAEGMARNGQHAAAILEKAFPKSTIQLIPFKER